MPHLFVARLWFEGNRFSPLPTGLDAFRQREWTRGPAALAQASGTATELGAVADFLHRRPGWRCTVGRCASASPGGPIDDALFDAFVAECVADLRAAAPDAVYLSLHGAAITDRRDAPETELLTALRAACAAGTPIAASFDLHGNLEPGLAALLDFGTAYRTYPHVDMHETAMRALDFLEHRTRAPVAPLHGTIAKLGALVPSFGMRSATEPMAGLQALARAAEREPGVVDVSVFGGFPYADTPDSDGAVMVWAATPALAAAQAGTLAQAYRERLPAFRPVLSPPAAALAAADAKLADDDRRPVVLTDPADNPLSGGGARTLTLLRALLAARRGGDAALARIAALPAGSVAFAYLAAPDAVRAATAAGVGATIRLVLDDAPPLALSARVVLLTDGRFVNTGPMERGAAVDAGPTAVVEAGGLRLVLASTVCAANDPGFFRLHGLDPADLRLLAVKAKNHFRAAFEPLCAAIIDVDCPGPAAADLATLPFRHWPRPPPG